jgi:hypothetical protein
MPVWFGHMVDAGEGGFVPFCIFGEKTAMASRIFGDLFDAQEGASPPVRLLLLREGRVR